MKTISDILSQDKDIIVVIILFDGNGHQRRAVTVNNNSLKMYDKRLFSHICYAFSNSHALNIFPFPFLIGYFSRRLFCTLPVNIHMYTTCGRLVSISR